MFSAKPYLANSKRLRYLILAFLAVLCAGTLASRAQESNRYVSIDSFSYAFKGPESDAQYKGGLKALNEYFSAQFRISDDYIWQNNKTARVILQFTVEENGDITDIFTVRHTLYMGNDLIHINRIATEMEGIIQRTSNN